MAFFPNKKSKSTGSKQNTDGQGAPGAATPTGTHTPSTTQRTTPTGTSFGGTLGTDRRPVVEGKPTFEDRISEAAIRERAHQIWVARGGGQGDELADWLLAKRELQEQEEAARRSASAGGTT